MRLAADNRTCERESAPPLPPLLPLKAAVAQSCVLRAAHETVLLIGRAGEIRGVDPDAPLVPIIPTVSGPHLTAPAVIHTLVDEGAIFWADTEVPGGRAAGPGGVRRGRSL